MSEPLYNKISKMILVDKISNDFSIERAIHSSQFLYTLWILSKKQFLSVEYWINDELFFIASTNAKTCKEALKSGKILEYLAGKAEFKLIKENIEIK